MSKKSSGAASSANADNKLAKSKKQDSSEFKPVDWKDPRLLAEMGVAAAIIVVFMALSGGFAAFM